MDEPTFSHLLLLILCFLVLFSPRPAFAVDILNSGANITDGQTLVSSDGAFIMGFFSPGASTKRYLGIWFSGSGSTDAVVWVANRERPVNDKTGALVVSATGSLLVLDGFMQVAWSSNSTSTSPTPVVEAQLLNSGNLVVRNRGSATILWQSFDYPSNAMVAGMKVGDDFWRGVEWHLTSWRSPDDPSPGAFRRVLDSSGGLPDLVVWKGNAKTLRTGPWNGLWFSGIPEVLSYKNLIDYQMVIIPKREVSYGFAIKPGAHFTYVVLADNGDVNRLEWDSSTGKWLNPYHGPRDVCDSYGKCGAFGMCNSSAASTGFCSCLRGFSPASPSEWKAREAAAGCRRDVMLDCTGKGPTTDGFMLVHGVKLPDTHNASVDSNTSITVEDCKVKCLASCSCVAYASADIRGNGSGCIIWTENLIDLRYVDGGQLLYLRLAKSELGEQTKVIEEPKKSQLLVILGSVVAAVVLLTLLAFLIIRNWWRVRRVCCCLPLNLETIRSATGHFSTRILGEGTFGIVYEGTLPEVHCPVHGRVCERTIAVKRLKRIAHLPESIARDFTREVRVSNRVRSHPNILQLLGHCQEGGEHILVYEYMHRRSLDTYIFRRNGTGERSDEPLHWQRRLKIIQDIAQGVNHLRVCKIIHRDLKPANVLLDNQWNAKVADFGTAKLYMVTSTAPSAGTAPRQRSIVGTRGYMAPEYVDVDGVTTFKCDVYSFGVTLLETLTGLKNYGSYPNLLSTARRAWSDGTPMLLLASAGVPVPEGDTEAALVLRRCIQIGLHCVQKAHDDRPDMAEVVRMLRDHNEQIPVLAIPEPIPTIEDQGDVTSLQEARLSSSVYETIDLTVLP